MGTFTTAAPIVTVTGKSGTSFSYKKYEFPTRFPTFPANYLFVQWTGSKFVAIYAGQTKNLAERFDNHHKMDAIRKAGATHLLVFSNSKGERARLDHEMDIVRGLNPKCND